MNIDSAKKEQIPALRALWKESFGDTDGFLDSFYATAFHPKRCRCILVEEEPVAALYWFHCLYQRKPVAYIYAVATAKAHRGKGLCHRLIADTHLYLEQQGYVGVLLVPGNQELFHLHESMGYQTGSYLDEFTCSSSKSGVPLEQIDVYQYTELRPTFLPQNSILQEDENLAFLQTQARFFSGPGFLLAAHTGPEEIFGVELLGDCSLAPEIVHSLGGKKGTFRTPGRKYPFTMYHPLGNTTLSPPSYFGFAYD